MPWHSHPSKGLIFSVTCLHFAKSYGWPSRECDGSDPAFRTVFQAILVASLPVSTGLDPSFRLVCCPVQTGKWFWLIVPLLESCYVSFDLPTQTQTEDLLSPTYTALCSQTSMFHQPFWGHWWNQCRKSFGVGRWPNHWKSLSICQDLSSICDFSRWQGNTQSKKRTWWENEVNIQRPASSSQQSIARGWVRSSGKISWQLKSVDWAGKKGKLPCGTMLQLPTSSPIVLIDRNICSLHQVLQEWPVLPFRFSRRQGSNRPPGKQLYFRNQGFKGPTHFSARWKKEPRVRGWVLMMLGIYDLICKIWLLTFYIL